MKRHFDDLGYTADCEGCARLSTGMKSRPHTGTCRARMYGELKKTEAGRKWMAEAENRINEYLEEQVRGDHEGKDKKEREDAETVKLSRWLEPMPRGRNSRRAKEKRRLELTKLIETSVSLKGNNEKLARQWWKQNAPPPQKRRRPARGQGNPVT